METVQVSESFQQGHSLSSLFSYFIIKVTKVKWGEGPNLRDKTWKEYGSFIKNKNHPVSASFQQRHSFSQARSVTLFVKLLR